MKEPMTFEQKTTFPQAGDIFASVIADTAAYTDEVSMTTLNALAAQHDQLDLAMARHDLERFVQNQTPVVAIATEEESTQQDTIIEKKSIFRVFTKQPTAWQIMLEKQSKLAA